MNVLVLVLLLATDPPNTTPVPPNTAPVPANTSPAPSKPSRIPSMAFIANSLGVTCLHCHVDKQWALDEKPNKAIARQHIAMTHAINEQHFKGAMVVTCNTCHNGQPRPAAIPLVANAGWNKLPVAAPALPAAEEVLARYERALGDPARYAVHRISRGTVTRHSGREPQVSQPFSMDDDVLTTELPYPPEANREVRPFFFNAPKLRQRYKSFATLGTDTIRGRNAIVVEATPETGRAERLSFDAATGVLLRRYVELETPMGVLPAHYEFDDWRDVDGIKLPFRYEWARGDYRITHVFEAIERRQ